LIAEWQPAALVVGLPTSVQGEAHKMTRQAEDFARRLEKRFRLPVARVDERYTSVEAQSLLRGMKQKAVDSVAAQLILEQFFHEQAA
jgi:putative Holliday junction resolvase